MAATDRVGDMITAQGMSELAVIAAQVIPVLLLAILTNPWPGKADGCERVTYLCGTPRPAAR